MESGNEFISKKGDIPEHIDKLMEVINMKGWLVLFAVGLIALAALIWGIFGEIPKKETLEGVLIKEGGIGKISHGYEGEIKDLKVGVGDEVKKGECIGIIDRPELIKKILLAKKNGESIEMIKDLQAQLKYESSIISDYNGKIIEMKKNRGNLLIKGETLLSLEIDEVTYKDLIANFYVEADKTVNLKIGDEVEISPINIKTDEYGYLLGNITSITEYPLTKTAMVNEIGNEGWVDKFMKAGSSIGVKVDLIPERKSIENQTGYKWTIDKEHKFQLQSGTMISGFIVVRKESPISKILHSGGGSH